MTVTEQRRTGLPASLWSMAFTELWERFSFYGLQGTARPFPRLTAPWRGQQC